MPNYIYRKRNAKRRWGFGRGRKSLFVHAGKRSLYVFLPFWNMHSITDSNGVVTVI